MQKKRWVTAGCTAVVINLLACMINYLSFQDSNWLMLKVEVYGGEITMEYGFGGLRAVHIYAMTPDQLTTHTLKFSVLLFLGCTVLTTLLVYLLLTLFAKRRNKAAGTSSPNNK